MDKLKRRSFIKNHLLKYGSASINDLSKLLGVSTMTIRRDIDYFKTCGLVSVNYGGVYLRKKETIARSDIDTVFDGFIKEIPADSTLFIDCAEFAAFLTCNYTSRRFTVFTCSLKIMNLLSHCNNIVLCCIPGVFGKECNCFYGSTAVGYIRKYLFDFAIIYATGIDAEHGFLCENIGLGEIKKTATTNSKKVFAVINKDLAEMNTIIKFADYSDIDVLGSTTEIYDEVNEMLLHNNVKIITKQKQLSLLK